MRLDQIVHKLSKLQFSLIPQLRNTFQKRNWLPNKRFPWSLTLCNFITFKFYQLPGVISEKIAIILLEIWKFPKIHQDISK